VWRSASAGLSVLGCVHPAAGQTEWQLASTVNNAVLRVALQTCAQAVGAGPTKRIVVVRDRAGDPISPQVQVPDGRQLVFLPPSSPELQPTAHLGPFSDEPLAHQQFPPLDAREEPLAAREEPLAARGDRLQHPPDVIRSTASFHWRPAA
jgi:hypothetical protein